MTEHYNLIIKSLKEMYDRALQIQTNSDFSNFKDEFNTSFNDIQNELDTILKNKQNYLHDAKCQLFDTQLKNTLFFIAEKNREQNINHNTIYNKEAILTSLDKNLPDLYSRIIQLEGIEEQKFSKNPSLDIKDEEYFKNDIENFLHFNNLYKIYIDKETGEVFISDKLGKTNKELESLEDIQKDISNDHATPDYNYLENYMYTSTYQDIAVQLNKEINRKIDEPVLQKTRVEKYKEFDENVSKEVKDYLEKD